MPNNSRLSRRGAILGSAALGLAALPLPAQASAPALPSSGNARLRIRDVRAYAVPQAVFVQVVAEDGTSGWGEAGHEGGRDIARIIRDRIAPLARGADIFAAEPLWASVFFAIDELGPSGLATMALGGLDTALWDLRGKFLRQPVWALLGGKFRDRIKLYGSFTRAADNRFLSPDECAARASALVAEGFDTIKIRLGIREERLDPTPDPAIPVVRAVRRAVGDSITLYVDPNNGYSAARAINVGRQLSQEFGVTVYEQPVAKYAYDALAEVAAALDLEIAAGEYEGTLTQFHTLITRARVDVLNPDVAVLGGLTEAKKVAALAEAFNKPIAVHNARPTLLTAAHAHFLATCRLADRPQEHPGRERLANLWRFFNNRLVPEGGYLQVPNAPGLGLDVNEDAIKREAMPL
jgi:L-alanine-DL-glutamate epimerase-like enolase superfamily enzyme